MQTAISLLTHLAAVAAVMLLYYFIPVIIFYYEFYIRNKLKWQPLKIQKKQPGPSQIRREIKSSLGAMIIFTLAGWFMYEVAVRGYTRVYFDIHAYNWWYFALSFTLNVFANDTIFYWAHRFMHLKWVFPYLHLEHHKSTTPTPFGVLSFHPLEAFIHSMAYILLIFIIPVHPIMFGIFHAYNLFSNVAGHGGYELMPEKMRRHWLFYWQNTVTNHDNHHKKFNCNYGNYFVIWDLLMHTADNRYPKKIKRKPQTELLINTEFAAER